MALEDLYGRKLDVLINIGQMSSALMQRVESHTHSDALSGNERLAKAKETFDLMKEQGEKAQKTREEIQSLMSQIKTDLTNEIKEVKTAVENCCRESKQTNVSNQQGTVVTNTVANPTAVGVQAPTFKIPDPNALLKVIATRILKGNRSINNNLQNIASILENCCPGAASQTVSQAAGSNPIPSVGLAGRRSLGNSQARNAGGVNSGGGVYTPAGANNATLAPGGGSGTLSNVGNWVAVSHVMTRIERSMTRMIHDMGLPDWTSIFKGLITDEMRYITNMRAAAFETTNFGDSIEDNANAWIEMGEAAKKTGWDRTKIQELYLKESQKGLTLENKFNKLQRRTVKDQQRMVNAASQTAFTIGSNVDETTEMFSEWQRSLSLSNAELGTMGDSLKFIAKTTGVSGDNLLRAAKQSDDILRSLRKAGALNAQSASNSMQAMTLFNKYGMEDWGKNLLKALSSPRDLMEAPPAMRALIERGRDRAGIDPYTLRSGAVSKSRDQMRGLFQGMMDQMKGVLGVTEEQLGNLSQYLDDLDHGDVQDRQRALVMRRLLDRQGLDVNVAENLVKTHKEFISPTQRLQELQTKKAGWMGKAGAAAPFGLDERGNAVTAKMMADVDKGIADAGRSANLEKMNAFQSALSRSGSQDEALKRTNNQMKGQDKNFVPMTKGDFSTLTRDMVVDLDKESTRMGRKDDLLKTLDTDSMGKYKSFSDLQKGMLSGNVNEAAEAGAMFRTLSEQLEVRKKSEQNPVMDIRQDVHEINDMLRNHFQGILTQIGKTVLQIAMWGSAIMGLLSTALTAAGWYKFMVAPLLSGIRGIISSIFGGGAAAAAAGGAGAAGAGAAGGAARGGWWSKLNPRNWFGRGAAAGGAGAAGGAAGAAAGGAGRFAGLARGAARVSRALPVIGVAIDAGLRLKEASNVEQQFKEGKITADERETKHAGNAAGFVGGALGASGGAALGALTGPLAPIMVPVLAAVGYWVGDKLGSFVGENLWLPVKNSVVGFMGYMKDAWGGAIEWAKGIGKGIQNIWDGLGDMIKNSWLGRKMGWGDTEADKLSKGASEAAGKEVTTMQNADAALNNAKNEKERAALVKQRDDLRNKIQSAPMEDKIHKAQTELSGPKQLAKMRGDLKEGWTEWAMGAGKSGVQGRLVDHTKSFNDKYGLALTPQEMRQAIVSGNLDAYKATHMKADKGMEKLAEEGTKKGSIFTHDIYCESILEEMLKTMGGSLEAARASVAEKEKAMAQAQGLGAFASDQGKEANISGFNDKLGLATIGVAGQAEPKEEKQKGVLGRIADTAHRIVTSVTGQATSALERFTDKTIKEKTTISDKLMAVDKSKSVEKFGESKMVEKGLFDRTTGHDALYEANTVKDSERSLMAISASQRLEGQSEKDSKTSQAINSSLERHIKEVKLGEASSQNMGAFSGDQPKEALSSANNVTMAAYNLAPQGDQAIDRLTDVIDNRDSKVMNQHTTMQNKGLFSNENVKETNSEYLTNLSKYYGRDLNNVISSTRSGDARKTGTVSSGTSHYIDGEDQEYSTIASSLYSAQMLASSGKGSVSSNLFPTEDAETFVAKHQESSKPSDSRALIPGLDGILDHLSGEGADREKQMISYLKDIRNLLLREEGPPPVGSNAESATKNNSSRLMNWMTDRLTGAWSEMQHDASSPTSNLTGDTRGGRQ